MKWQDLNTACGWKVTNVSYDVDGSVTGDIEVPFKNDIYYMRGEWDKHGMPKDLTKNPSRYYTRIVRY